MGQALGACCAGRKEGSEWQRAARVAARRHVDHTSQSNFAQLRVTHSDFELAVDFGKQVITGKAKITAKALASSVSQLVLDTKELDIKSARILQRGGHDVKEAAFELGEENPVLGQALSIDLGSAVQKDEEVVVEVDFATRPSCSAIQFLEPAQTAGRQHPYLFSQCQAIHCRSMLPVQDTPGAKMTYTAEVTVPKPLTALMSAVIKNDGKAVREANGKQTFAFEQTQPISPYLVAIVVGELESRDIGPRSKVWSEPCMVEKGKYEFDETEAYIKAAEDIAGDYVWGRYDILLLPPSFPYGGMENPCLTFATPTLLAGDRSLTTVIAHEIAHSWTGNYVTNGNWEHFWLNEGCNVFLERKIIKKLFGEELFNLHAEQGRGELMKACERIGEDHNFTRLSPDLSDGKDPDDAFSRIPYEKGFYFNMYLERLVGEDRYMPWFKDKWIQGHAKQTVDSIDFQKCFSEAFPKETMQVNWNAWFYKPGKPIAEVTYNDTLGTKARELAAKWTAAEGAGEGASLEDIKGWHAPVLQLFLDQLSAAKLPLDVCKKLGEVYELTKSRNSEIRHRWYEVSIASHNAEVLPKVKEFITEQGRMKYIRPLYRSLFVSEMPGAKELALETFNQHKGSYHPVARKMLEADLNLRAATAAAD